MTGQDGSYLAESLLSQGWAVHGLARHAPAHPHINEGETLVEGVQYHVGDLSRPDEVGSILKSVQPDLVFNLGGISSVYQSWQQPYETALVSGASVVSMLEATWQLQQESGKEIRFLQASSAELFGEAKSTPQNEMTPISPVSPYGAAKAFAHHAVSVYRGRGMFAASAILYNHESLRRPAKFVTRKITAGAAAIAAGKLDKLSLGNLSAVRDWGWAPDFVDAMERILNAPEAMDFVVATGVSHSVQDFVEAAFAAVGIEDWRAVVEVDDSLARPSDAAEMRGDITKISSELGWQPSMDFESLVAAMVRNDQSLLQDDQAPQF
ncbi:GDP-mannose 4,6-dehydratase [Arthrobacter sp. B1I2]|uniref:GDP-mannose 4,6-dehydratase n=1 Tax=Arthrobacter sp. B1I2 TaxID=3042263 RepID=UPI0027B8B941|nr:MULTISPECIES: GDP-mannose 4,6-dehydratase [Arthrobacter]